MDLMLLSFFHFYVVLFNFLWLAGLLMDMQWPRLPLIYIFSHYVFCLSRRYVSLNGHDRDHLQRLLSFFFSLPYINFRVRCYKFYNCPSLTARFVRRRSF